MRNKSIYYKCKLKAVMPYYINNPTLCKGGNEFKPYIPISDKARAKDYIFNLAWKNDGVVFPWSKELVRIFDLSEEFYRFDGKNIIWGRTGVLPCGTSVKDVFGAKLLIPVTHLISKSDTWRTEELRKRYKRGRKQ